jgi:hypothetical protein
VRAGTYNEGLIIPDGISLSGDSVQTVRIQQLGVTDNRVLITMGNNCRIENFTAILTSELSVHLTGIEFPSGTQQTSTLRNSVWNITSNASAGIPRIVGCLSSGSSSTDYTTPNAIQQTTFNVISSSPGATRGILVNGPNRFSVRDIVVYASGAGADIVGVETADAGAVFEVKTSTIGGESTGIGAAFHDINRTAGKILLGTTDLLNNDANGNSFTPAQAPASFQFGTVKSLATNMRYYLLPGTSAVSNLESNPGGNPYDSTLSFPVLISQPSTVIETNISYKGVIGAGQSITFNVHKNNDLTPVVTLTLNEGETTKTNATQSVKFDTDDTLECTLVTVGNPATDTKFSAIVYYY